ncbi:MAG TPA: hypothetical protein VL294_06285 [Pseudolysinimonas sp.]|jgi:hypothetical protein|nr:hypothetical protein [Pseudolysinimonas sp.]
MSTVWQVPVAPREAVAAGVSRRMLRPAPTRMPRDARPTRARRDRLPVELRRRTAPVE